MQKMMLNDGFFKAAERLKNTHLKTLFEKDEDRFNKFCARADTIILDYSKNKIDDEAMTQLVALADRAGLSEKIEAMFSGATINRTEGRAVLHTALRAPASASVVVDGVCVADEVHAVLEAMGAFSDAVRNGQKCGATGKAFRDVVNIGIGGSDLGPAMVVEALTPYCDGPRCHFVSNVDGAHLHDTLKELDPATTLFLVASKTFTTQETMTNAHSARAWLSAALGDDAVKAHFAAISTNLDAVASFGIEEDCIFGFWDWVGGRYSVWSAIGLSVMLAIGKTRFRAFLDGAYGMDRHFRDTPFDRNLPVILALIGVWYRNLFGYAAHAVLPYDQRLARFPAYLQQLDMESNGKRVSLEGQDVEHKTGPIIWGEPGTNGQHAFYQLLHQGQDIIPCDFLLAANPQEDLGDHHLILAANCLAQSEALMQGKPREQVEKELGVAGLPVEEIDRLAPHKVFPGDRPSNTLLYERLDPGTLGALIALYEHKVFVQGVLWGINSFDQWGVELGKELAKGLLPMMRDGADASMKDASTRGLLQALRALRG